MPKSRREYGSAKLPVSRRARVAEAARLAKRAEKLRKVGEEEKNRELLERAQALDSDNAEAAWWLGDYWHGAGDTKTALKQFRRYLRIHNGDPEALHMIAALGGRPKPRRASDGYVRDHFDAFAEHFDESLVQDLKYQAPKLLYKAVRKVRGRGRGLMDMLDLGVGTGLAGMQFQSIVNKVWGVDLSTEMAKRARARGIYETVAVSEITAYMRKTQRQFDLVTAADVLIYFGDLSGVFKGVDRVLRADGLFALSSEMHTGEDFRLTNSGRYSHSLKYLRRLAKDVGMVPAHLDRGRLRYELGKPVNGHVVVFAKKA